MDYDVSELTAGQAPTATAGGVISIGRKKYAVNLYWQPSPSGRVSQAAREAAGQPGQMADFYAVRPGTSNRVPQFALGQKDFGHRAGQPTGAASLAEDQPGSWGGVFRVAEGWWLVISRDDLIAPDGDILFADENEARQRLYEEINLGGLQRIYAPDNWAVPGGDPIPLTLLLQGRADYRLQYVKYPIKAIALGLLILAAVGGAGYYALNYQQEQLSEFEKSIQDLSPEEQARARLQQQAQFAPPPPPPPPKRVWEDAPRPTEMLNACQQTLQQVPATALGWGRGEVVCDGHNLVVAWNRQQGPAIVPPNAQITGLRDNTASTYPLPNLTARGAEELSSNGTVMQEALMDNWPITLAVIPDEVVTAAPAAPGMQPPPAPPPPPWIKKKITFTSDNAPWYIWARYAAIKGLVLDRVVWNGSDWTFEGTLYENR